MKKSLAFASGTAVAALLLTGVLYTALAPEPAPLLTVPAVDLPRYMGKWYEISAFPQRFQEGCHCTTAQYALKAGYVEVLNSCLKGSARGKVDTAIGKAFVVAGSNHAKLRVQFFWPFKGNYWILYLDAAYSRALVGSPDRQYLWILARTRELDAHTYQQLVQKAQQLGFDTSKLRLSDQSCPDR